jgi:hypothetical protein
MVIFALQYYYLPAVLVSLPLDTFQQLDKNKLLYIQNILSKLYSFPRLIILTWPSGLSPISVSVSYIFR